MRCRPLKAIGTLAIIGVAGVSRRLVLVDGLEVSPTRRTISTAQFSTRPTRALLPTPRRDVVEWTVTAAAAATVALVVNVPPAAAAAEVAAPPTPMETVNVLLNKLKNIPTFCIVDSQDGAAYMAFKPDQAMAIGYAFTTFPGALADAQRVAKEKNYAATWERATVTTLPLDIAVRLSLKKRSRVSQKEQTIDSLLQVIPGAVRSKTSV